MTDVKLYLGDCLEVMRGMPDNSVDAVVTDPPYELGFMGKAWDNTGIAYNSALWSEVLRVLKPGGHLLAFGGSRTYHRMACAIEDAGFEIRDQIMWVYGCLSEDTEILTKEGWRRYHKSILSDSVLCYNKDNGSYEYHKPTEMFWYENKHTAYRIKSDSTDQIVSRNHRVLVERGGREIFAQAETLQHKENVPILESLSSLPDTIYDYDDRKSDIVQNEQRTQTVRTRAGHTTTLATVEPIEYKGHVWCVSVPTGAFVARRNGQIFITGNSGFPKSLNIGKAIDKQAGAEREVVGKYESPENTSGGKGRKFCHGGQPLDGLPDITAPATPEAQLWDGWGTALKPAHEPICMARKPLSEKSVAENVLKWGTGGINIDGCRVGFQDDADYQESTQKNRHGDFNSNGGIRVPTKGIYHGDNRPPVNYEPSKGRFPANFIHDGSDEVKELFPQSISTDKIRHNHQSRYSGMKENGATCYGKYNDKDTTGYSDSGSAARFFYCAKSSKSERNGGLDGYLTVKYNNDKSNSGGLSWKDVSTVAVQLLRRVMSDLAAMSFNIGESGESITALCPKDSLSTTLTAISKIIELKILHSLTLSLTNEYTVGANYEMANGGNLAESVVSLRKWILTITSGCLELARGASSVALQTLLKIRNADEWSQATNFHSTVKPLALMRYLVRLTKTPTGGTVLDPFMGSGTTGIACLLEGREFIGIEREPDYMEIARRRIEHWAQQQPRLI